MIIKYFYFITLLVLAPYIARSQQDHQFDRNKSVLKSDPVIKKLGSDLMILRDEYDRFTKSGGITFSPSNKLLQIRDNYITIEAAAESDADVLYSDLIQMGLNRGTVFGRTVSGQLPLESLGEVAELKSLRFARPAYRPITQIGNTTSQGDSTQNSTIDSCRYKPRWRCRLF